jgi:hypothetical protein
MQNFSIPLNPKLDYQSFTERFIPFLEKHKEYIYDVYFTSRIPPFGQDAMGDVFHQGDWSAISENAVQIQEILGIPVSATFNNINVAPTMQNLHTWCKNFAPMYEAGVRIATLPHTIWMLQGVIQKQFPELRVKNTILRNVQRANEVVKLAEAGFYYVNLDRDLMRDRDKLLEIKEAKEYVRKNICPDFKISLLANEGCWGNCPVQDEHFEFNFSRSESNNPTFFMDPISKPTCPKWDAMDPAASLKVANFTPWREDWLELMDLGIDVFKMHGRESADRLWETVDLVEKFVNKQEILFDNFNEFIEVGDLENKPIKVWRDKIKNCKFNCWKCHYCEDVVSAKTKNKFITAINNAYEKSINEESKCSDFTLNIEGLTSNKIKHFLNNLCNTKDVRYLEVGTWHGATFCSAIENNNVQAICIDSWHTNTIEPMREVEGWKSKDGNPLEIFQKNLQSVKGKNNVQGFNEPVESLDLTKIPYTCNIVFYDGDHSFESTKNFLDRYYEKFEETMILIVDDWNWPQIKNATQQHIEQKEYKVLYEKLIETTGEDPQDFWNGLGIFVLRKKRENIT